MAHQLFFLRASFLLTVLVGLQPQGVDAAIACNETHNPCEELLYKGSECRDGFCSNPFEKGCLHTILNEKYGPDELLPSLARRLQRTIRVCNSEDPPEARGVVCTDHQSLATSATGYGARLGADIYADYPEVRILSQNWESAFLSAWVLQILLSEVLQVPTSIETSKADTHLNFYSATNSFQYGGANDWSAINAANAAPLGDCRLREPPAPATEEGVDVEYESCAHVMPELWSGNNLKDLWNNHREGIVDPPEGLGAIAYQGIFVPKFTAERDPTVLNILGIAGEENRQKMADMFLRPTTWKDYCEEVSKTNCTEPDDVAQRPPESEAEDTRYHFSGVFTGHFRATDENNCTKNPTTCTGHVADYPCGWGSFLAAQIYHHNIPIKSSGPEYGSNGYTYGQLVDMYKAANETRSNYMTMWWQPEALYSTFQNTDAEMQNIVLPAPSQECVDNRIRTAQRCEFENDQDRYGDPEGACMEAPQLLQKVVASSLYKMTYENENVPEARQSPAYEAIKAFKINELQVGKMLQMWISRGLDTYGFDARLAACEWVGSNLEFLEDFVPRRYPRVAQEQDIATSPLFYVAVSAGSIATILTVIITFLTYRRRNGYVMKFSQWEFLILLLLGLLLVSVGSILLAIPPNDASCVTIQWLLMVGYTSELVPLIVKVGAMNRLITAAKKMKRIVLTKSHLFGTVAMFMVVCLIYLIVWTSVDAPQRKGEYTLTDDITEDGELIVTVGYYCSSSSDIWRYIAVIWHCLLLLFATVLAVQTRNLQKGFSESSVLAIIIYSHFVFVMLRVITFLLGGVLLESQVAGFRSLIYSADALVTLGVYFVPKLLTDDDKFYNLTHGPQRRGNGRSVVTMIPDTGTGSGLRSDNGKSFLMMNNDTGMSGCGSGGSLGTGPGAMGSGAISKPFKSKDFDPDSSESEDEDGDEAQPLPVSSNHKGKSAMKQAGKPKDVLGNRVSWGGMGLTTVFRSSRHSDSDDDEKRERAPFKKPVDVLKGSTSWAGAGVTMILRSDAESSSTLDDDGRSGDIEEAEEEEKPRSSLLSAPSLPKEAPVRFDYATSRINKARHRHSAERHDDENLA